MGGEREERNERGERDPRDTTAPLTIEAEHRQSAAFELAIASDVGTERNNNEDAFGSFVESPTSVVFAVADGVGGYEGGEVASRMAIDETLDAYRKAPLSWGPAKRLARAAQRANITIHDRAVVVTELRRMATTLTAASVDAGVLRAVHVGDCRIYLIRAGRMTQLTKDHTVASSRVRLGVLAKEKLREHPERGTLTRSLGPELIAAVDRIATPLAQGDTLLIASDGLYNTLNDDELLACASENKNSAPDSCRALIELANHKGTSDNLTAAVFRQVGPVAEVRRGGLRARLDGLLGARFRRT
jgi:serine/threonine protein phosphatase PrpC